MYLFVYTDHFLFNSSLFVMTSFALCYSTNISTFLHKDKMDGSGSRRESLLSLEESSSEAG